MLLEMSGNLLEISVKQLVIQSRLASLISRGNTMFGVWKTKCKCCFRAVESLFIAGGGAE